MTSCVDRKCMVQSTYVVGYRAVKKGGRHQIPYRDLLIAADQGTDFHPNFVTSAQQLTAAALSTTRRSFSFGQHDGTASH
jgi:hypothetical protein